MKTVLEDIRELIYLGTQKVYPKLPIDDIDISIPKEKKWGDYASNVAFVIKRAQRDTKSSSIEVAKLIMAEVDKANWVEVSVEGAGFLNFKLKPDYLIKQLKNILAAGVNYGRSDWGKDLNVLVEFISANPTGPLTLGNGRGGFGGDVLANCFEIAGAKVTREYYINDMGNQIEDLGHSVLKDDKAVYKGEYIDELAKHRQGDDPKEVGKTAAYYIFEENIRKTIERAKIKFDNYFSEQTLYDQAKVAHIMGVLKKNELIYEKDGATWLKTTKFDDEKDRVLIKENGDYTYFASDLAYHFDKIERGFNLLIDIWGADHHGHVKRMQGVVDSIWTKELDWSGELKILICQLVRLVSKGKEVRMSKREGTYVTLDELIEAVGLDVARYFFLSRAYDTHMDFDLDLAKEHSLRNPVYYIQYAHARICSLEKEALNKGYQENIRNDVFKNNIELDLIKKLLRFPEIIMAVTADYGVQRLANYSYEVAETFHQFYEECRIVGEDKGLGESRLALAKATRMVIKQLLTLMGIEAPEHMEMKP